MTIFCSFSRIASLAMMSDEPEYPEKTPGDELQKMPHTTARRLKPK